MNLAQNRNNPECIKKGFIYIGIIYYDNVHKVLCVTKLIIQRVQIPFLIQFQPKPVFKKPFQIFVFLLARQKLFTFVITIVVAKLYYFTKIKYVGSDFY